MIFLLWVVLGVVTGIFCGVKGYSTGLAILLGFTGPIGLIIAAVLPNRNKKEIH